MPFATGDPPPRTRWSAPGARFVVDCGALVELPRAVLPFERIESFLTRSS